MWLYEDSLLMLTDSGSHLKLDMCSTDCQSEDVLMAGLLLCAPMTPRALQCIAELQEMALKMSPTIFSVQSVIKGVWLSGTPTSIAEALERD